MATPRKAPATEGARGSEPTDLAALCRRTGVPEWIAESPTLRRSFLLMSAQEPAELDALAARWGGLRARLPAEEAAPETAADQPLPPQESWVRAAGQALCGFPELELAVGTSGQELVELADKDTLLRSLGHWAG